MGIQARNNRREHRDNFHKAEVVRLAKYKASADLIRNVEPLKTDEELRQEMASREKKAKDAAKAKKTA